MQFLFRCLPKPHSHHHGRTFVDATIKHVRDRGLDHAVEREKNLKPLHDIKNMIKSEVSKSLPITLISEHRDSLNIPFRPIELTRKYPSIFQEFHPGGTTVHPHIKLTPALLNLDADENLVYQSHTYKQNVADRLLKLLMLSRMNKIPLRILETLKWDLGLPNDYAKSVVPDFPDYFRVIGGGSESVLELVCWSDELAVSVIEKKVMKPEMGYQKGMPIAFSKQFSRDFEMDKDMKKWMDDWQKLPYVSPYENSVHLSPTSDESDKWAAGVLHELLHLFVGKKAEKDNVLCLGEYLGIRSRFKRVLLHHPGIFYVSSKIGTYTVVLKDGYKRGLLIESNPLMSIRNQYLHLMHMVKEDKKSTSVSGGSTQQQKEKTSNDDDNAEEDDVNDDYDDEEEDDDDDEENESHGDARKNVSINRGRTNRKTNLDVKWGSRNTKRERSDGKHSRNDDDDDDEEEEEDENESHGDARKNVSVNRGRTNFDVKGGSRNTERERSGGKHFRKAEDTPKFSRRTEMHGGHNSRGSSQEGFQPKFSRRRTSEESFKPKFSRRADMHGGHNSRGTSEESFKPKFSRRTDMHGGHNSHGNSQESFQPKFSRRTEMHGGHNSRGTSEESFKAKFSRKTYNGSGTSEESFEPKFSRKTRNGRGTSEESFKPKFSRKTDMHGGHNGRGNSQGRSSSPRRRGSSLTDKRAST